MLARGHRQSLDNGEVGEGVALPTSTEKVKQTLTQTIASEYGKDTDDRVVLANEVRQRTIGGFTIHVGELIAVMPRDLVLLTFRMRAVPAYEIYFGSWCATVHA